VNLDPVEYRKLIELAYLGEWMINAHHEPEYSDEEAGRVLQRVLSAAPLEGIGTDDETGEKYMDTDWIERLYETYVMDYDDHVFWDELAERLAQRDLAKSRGVEMDDINRDDDLLELRPLEERYREELEEHGIDRLEIRGDY
jgi:hypothetical protein